MIGNYHIKSRVPKVDICDELYGDAHRQPYSTTVTAIEAARNGDLKKMGKKFDSSKIQSPDENYSKPYFGFLHKI